MKRFIHLSTYAAAIIFLSLQTPAFAQAPQGKSVTIRGKIATVEGQSLNVATKDGEVTVRLPADVRIGGVESARLSDIKSGEYVGTTAVKQSDSNLKALEVHIFPESARGTGEGHRPWDLQPGSTMTNAAVETTAGSVDGQVLTVKYKQGDKVDEKKVIVPPDAAIVTYAPGDKSELKPGAQIIIFGAQKQADGTLQAQAVNVGRGIAPPM